MLEHGLFLCAIQIIQVPQKVKVGGIFFIALSTGIRRDIRFPRLLRS